MAAVKLELVPVVAAAVRVIVGEEDHPGHGDSPRSCVQGNRSNSAGHRIAQRGNNPPFSRFWLILFNRYHRYTPSRCWCPRPPARSTTPGSASNRLAVI